MWLIVYYDVVHIYIEILKEKKINVKTHDNIKKKNFFN